MKYRIQFLATYDNTDANAILNEIESIKADVFNPENPTLVPIIRQVNKEEYVEDFSIPEEFATVDFDAEEDTHSGAPTGISEFQVNIDISFAIQQDFYDFMNYLESMKDDAIVNNKRLCRHFECKHEENPLSNDGDYIYMDFDGSQLTYPI